MPFSHEPRVDRCQARCQKLRKDVMLLPCSRHAAKIFNSQVMSECLCLRQYGGRAFLGNKNYSRVVVYIGGLVKSRAFQRMWSRIFWRCG